jgi:hypothetical protein
MIYHLHKQQGETMGEDTKTAAISKLIDRIPALLIVFGILVVVLGIAKGITYNSWLPIPDWPSRVVAGAFGVALIIMGLFGLKPTAVTLKSEDYGIRITHPKPGASVVVTDVSGEIKKPLPDHYTLRVFRVYARERFFPLRDCRVKIEGNYWEATGCDLGSAASGETRIFAVNIVGPDGAALIDYVRNAAQVHNPVHDALEKATGNKNVPYLPLIELLGRTRDMIECDRVEVRRA